MALTFRPRVSPDHRCSKAATAAAAAAVWQRLMRLRCRTLLCRGRRLLRLLLAACRRLELCPPLLILAHELRLLSTPRVSSLELAAEIGNLGGGVSSKLGARRAVHLTERTQSTAHQP